MGGGPTTDVISGTAAGAGTYNVGLVMADVHTVPTLVSLPTGLVNGNTATTTIEAAKIYSIANSLAACVNSSGETSTTETTTLCGQLFAETATPGSTSARPLDTLQAAVQMSRYPYQNVSAIYMLAPPKSPFVGLAVAPNDWTVGVMYTTPAMGLGINNSASDSETSSTIDIDATGRVWFPTTMATAHGVGNFDPTTGTFSGPFATVLVHPQYVAIDRVGTVWATDLSSGALVSTPSGSPNTLGTPYYLANSTSAGPLAIDNTDNVLYASTTAAAAHSLVRESNGALTTLAPFALNPTGIVYAPSPFYTDSVIATTSQAGMCNLEEVYVQDGQGMDYVDVTSGGGCISGGMAISTGYRDAVGSFTSKNRFAEEADGDSFGSPVPIDLPEGQATDGLGAMWVANSGNGSVSTFGYNDVAGNSTDYFRTSTIAYLHGTKQWSDDERAVWAGDRSQRQCVGFERGVREHDDDGLHAG